MNSSCEQVNWLPPQCSPQCRLLSIIFFVVVVFPSSGSISHCSSLSLFIWCCVHATSTAAVIIILVVWPPPPPRRQRQQVFQSTHYRLVCWIVIQLNKCVYTVRPIVIHHTAICIIMHWTIKHLLAELQRSTCQDLWTSSSSTIVRYICHATKICDNKELASALCFMLQCWNITITIHGTRWCTPFTPLTHPPIRWQAHLETVTTINLPKQPSPPPPITHPVPPYNPILKQRSVICQVCPRSEWAWCSSNSSSGQAWCSMHPTIVFDSIWALSLLLKFRLHFLFIKWKCSRVYAKYRRHPSQDRLPCPQPPVVRTRTIVRAVVRR